MEESVKIDRINVKGKIKYSCIAYGKYGEFDSQLEAANFADACAEIYRRNKENGK